MSRLRSREFQISSQRYRMLPMTWTKKKAALEDFQQGAHADFAYLKDPPPPVVEEPAIEAVPEAVPEAVAVEAVAPTELPTVIEQTQ